MTTNETRPTLHLAARDIPVPTSVSAEAQAIMAMPPMAPTLYPPLDDVAAWQQMIAEHDDAITAMMADRVASAAVKIEDLDLDGVRVYEITPLDLVDGDRRVYLDIHGGGFIFGRGESCRAMSTGTAARVGARVWSVDYRMPPEHPFPAGLDDCLTAYRALLQDHDPTQLIVGGASAGGNLAAALVLRARDEGLPLPAAAVLMTPATDLTESGDSVQTNLGLDPLLTSRATEAFQLYAGEQSLDHPYVSPLFGDLRGWPPTFLSTGTRDLLLSDTVRMHRALRNAGVPADLHVTEAAGHGGFLGMAPEDHELERQIRAFVDNHWGQGPPS